MNKVTLLGRLTKDPEFDQTTSGISVSKFTLAVNRRYTNEDGEREADFINIVAWRTNADICHKYLKKGSQVCIVGAIQTRSYEAQDGTKRFVVEVIAEEVEFVGSKTIEEKEEPKKEIKEVKLEPIENDTLPF
ncbi:MAG: single-stranded DNA-binding protein [Clostridia bacterium]|nr:single-stranded DNA-binding protein [Clostridia bacterium]